MADTENKLTELFGAPRCPACAAADQAAHSYIKGVMSDGVNDPVLRAEWRRGGGLCRAHWQVLSAVDTPALSAAIMGRDLLEAALRSTQRSNSGRSGKARSGLAGLADKAVGRSAHASCPACTVSAKAERHALGRLNRLRLPASGLGDTRGFVCLAHLEQLRNEPLRQAVLERLEAMLGELDEFVRKSDYRFADEAKGDERDAWVRAIRVLSGPR